MEIFYSNLEYSDFKANVYLDVKYTNSVLSKQMTLYQPLKHVSTVFRSSSDSIGTYRDERRPARNNLILKSS